MTEALSDARIEEFKRRRREAAQLQAGAKETPETPEGVIQGFSAQPRSDSLAQNFNADFWEMAHGYGALVNMVEKDGISAVGTMIKAMPEAFKESYARWGRAADEGRFWEMAHAHPLEFVQDWSLPISVAFSGGATLAPKIFGTGATVGKATAAAAKIAKWADRAALVTDPLGNAAAYTVKRAVGTALRTALNSTPANPLQIKSRLGLADPEIPAVEKPLGDRAKDMFDAVQTSMVDEAYPIHKKAREVYGTENNKLSQTVRGLTGVERKASAAVGKGYWEPDNILQPLVRDAEAPAPHLPVEGLEQIVRDIGETNLGDVLDYAVARRAVYDHLGFEKGIDMDMAKQVLKDFDPAMNPHANPDVHTGWQRWRQFQDDRLSHYQRSGFMSKETLDSLRKENPNWVSFQRTGSVRVKLSDTQKAKFGVKDDYLTVSIARNGAQSVQTASGGAVRNPKQVLKEFKGSVRAIQNPLYSDIMLSHTMMREAELNQIAGEVRKLADIEGSGVRIVDAPEGFSSEVALNEIKDALERADGVPEGMDPAQFLASKLTRPDGLPENTIIHFQDGKKTFIQVDDPAIHQAYASLRLSKESDLGGLVTGVLGKVARGASQLQRAGITTAPSFTLGLNVIRDQWQALTYSKYGYVPFYDFGRGLASYMKRGELYDIWAKSGGMNSHLTALDRPAMARAMQEYLRPANRGYLQSIAHTVKHPIEALQMLNEATESATRMGEFNRVLESKLGKLQRGDTWTAALQRAAKEGLDTEALIKEASVASKDVTVDFAKRGADPTMRALNSITAFQNAQIQSLDLFRRKMMKGEPGEQRKLILRATLGITIPSLLLMAQNANDPEQADTPQHEKNAFWHARIPGGPLLRVPKPFEVGFLFGTMPVRMLESMSEADPSILTNATEAFARDLQPFGMPTIVKTPMEVAMNHNLFFDAPLEPASQQRFTKSERVLPSTTEFARVMSKFSEWANEKVPGSKYKPREAVLSPIQIDHLISGFTGTIGRGVAEYGADPVLRALGTSNIGERPAPPSGVLQQIPIANRFVANPYRRSQERLDFYEINEALSKKLNQLKSVTQPGDKQKLWRENRTDIIHAALYAKVAQQMFELSKAQKIIYNNRRLTADQKREQMEKIDRHMNRLAAITNARRKKELQGK